MCKENNWCRDWRETRNGIYPASEHAPGCDEYVEKGFIRIRYQGSNCIMEVDEANDFIKEIPDYEIDEHEMSGISLTQDQFDNLEEFTGW